MATVYEINKGINRSLEFKGIKAQYIIFLAIGLVLLLLSFAVLYMFTKNVYLCLGIVIPSTVALYITVHKYSKQYGENGLIKKIARKKLPTYISTTSRNFFIQLSAKENEEKEETGRSSGSL